MTHVNRSELAIFQSTPVEGIPTLNEKRHKRLKLWRRKEKGRKCVEERVEWEKGISGILTFQTSGATGLENAEV